MLFSLPLFAAGVLWDPTAESLNVLYQAPNYVTAPSASWAPTVGTVPLTQTAAPPPAAVGGAPDCEVSTDFPLGATLDPNTVWAVDPAHTFFAVIILESISRNGANPWQNDGLIADSANYCGLFLRDNLGALSAIMYEWDTAARSATVDITSLLTGDAGFLVVQGKKEGGILYIRAANATTTTGWVAGNACGNLSSAAANIRAGSGGGTADGVLKCIGSAPTAWSDETAARFEAWARRVHSTI